MKAIFKSIIEFVTNRVFLLFFIILLLFSILVIRLFNLQIIRGEEFKNKFRAGIKKEISVDGMRGNIYDRYGRILAENDYVFSIQYESVSDVNDDEMNEMFYKLIQIIHENGEQLVNEIPIAYKEDIGFYYIESYSSTRLLRFKKDIIGENLTEEQKTMNAEELYTYMKEDFKISDDYSIEDSLKIIAIQYEIYMNRYHQYQPITLAKDVKKDTIVKIKEHQEEFKGINVTTDTIRIYPYDIPLSHIVGYTGLIDASQLNELKDLEKGYDRFDIVGKTGIEKEMEVYLKGKDGKKVYEVNHAGKIISQSEDMLLDPTQGDNIYLTIDADLQVKLYELLEKKITDILVDKIVLTKKNKKDILLSEVFFGMINNHFIDVDELNKDNLPYSNKLYNLYETYNEDFKDRFNQVLFSDSTYIKNYDEVIQGFYVNMVQNMIDRGRLNTQYRNDAEFYKAYGKYETTAKEFFAHCYKNDYIDMDYYDFEIEGKNESEIVNSIIESELETFLKTDKFKFPVYEHIILKGYISYRDLTLLLYEQNKIFDSEDEINKVRNGRIHPLTVIEDKLLAGEITPQDLALDPSSGSIVVTDVNTGEVLSMVSYPSYDNNRLVNTPDNVYFQKLLSDKTTPLINRAVKERTEPGSTFKMLTAMAGLEEGVITTTEKIYSKGTFDKYIAPYPSCWIAAYGGSHGLTDVSKAIEVSCNYFFSEVAYRMGSINNVFTNTNSIQTLDKYIHMFGLDAPSGVELSESYPSNESTDALREAFGNEKNIYTPSQLARYIISLANGGTTYNLYMVDKVMTQEKNIAEDKEPSVYYQNNFQPENIKVVQQGMYKVTAGASGTVRKVFSDFPMDVAGKTGTAQQNKNRPDHALFAGYAPYQDPQIAVSVVIPFGYTSDYTAELFKEVVATYFELYNENEQTIEDNKFVY